MLLAVQLDLLRRVTSKLNDKVGSSQSHVHAPRRADMLVCARCVQDRASLAPAEELERLVDLPTPAVMRRYVDWQLRCLGSSAPGGGDAASVPDSASVASGSVAGGAASAGAGESARGSSGESGSSSGESDGSGSSSDSSEDEEEWLEVSVAGLAPGLELLGHVPILPFHRSSTLGPAAPTGASLQRECRAGHALKGLPAAPAPSLTVKAAARTALGLGTGPTAATAEQSGAGRAVTATAEPSRCRTRTNRQQAASAPRPPPTPKKGGACWRLWRLDGARCRTRAQAGRTLPTASQGDQGMYVLLCEGGAALRGHT